MILQTFDLGKRFGNRWAVKDLNISIEKGQVYGFLGPNGAGKSTTIRMLLQLIRPSDGTFELLSRTIKGNRNKIYARIGALVEKPDFYLYLTAEKNLKMLGALSGGVTEKRIYEVLDIVDLSDRARDMVRNYSHGMKQRLGIAQALLANPELVILDEPTSGLDPEGIHEIRELIVSLARDQNITIMLSSHLLHEVEQTCTHMGIIDNGTLVVQGAVDELLRTNEFFITEVSVDNPQRALKHLQGEDWIREVSLVDETLKVSIDSDKRPKLTEYLVRNHFEVYAIMPRTSLEDYYLSLLNARHG